MQEKERKLKAWQEKKVKFSGTTYQDISQEKKRFYSVKPCYVLAKENHCCIAMAIVISQSRFTYGIRIAPVVWRWRLLYCRRRLTLEG